MKGTVTYVWLIVIAALAMVELMAIRNPVPGDTLSEHWWWVRDHNLGARLLLFGGWGWLTWHFLFGRSGWYGWPDGAAIALGLTLGLATWWAL